MELPKFEMSDREHRRPGFDAKGRRIVRAFCEAMLSDEDERGKLVAPSASLVDRVLDEYDRMLGAGSLTVRNGMRALTRIVNRLPLVVLGTTTPMTELTLPERVVYLDALENARVGLMATALVALKLPVTMLAYEQGELLASLGFERESIPTPRGDVPIPVPRPWDEGGRG